MAQQDHHVKTYKYKVLQVLHRKWAEEGLIVLQTA